MREKSLTKTYYGLEALNGTAVAADTQFLLNAQPIGPDYKNEIIEEDTGTRSKGVRVRAGDVKFIADVLRFEDAYFQALPVLFSCGLKGNITPVEQNPAEGDYLWTFDPSLTSTNNIDSITLETGDDVDAFEREYTMFEGYRIQFDIPQSAENAKVLIEGQYFSRQNTKAAFTPAIAIPSTENIVAKLIRIYVDTAWANLGNTEKAILRKGDIQIMTGVHAKMLGSQNKYFDTHGEGDIHMIAAFTFEGNAAADDLSDLAASAADSFLRLEVEGSQIGAGDNHKLTIDASGFWKDPVKMAEVSAGNNLHTMVFETKEDLVASKLLELAVTTDVSAI
jgi:hypothetical protein